MSAANEGLLRALSSGLDRLQAATTATINRPLTPAVQVLDSGKFQKDRKLSAGQIGNYLLHGGVHCPDCLSHQITGGQFDVSEGRCWQTVSCTVCGLEWTDEYSLVSVNHVSFAPLEGKGGKPIEE